MILLVDFPVNKTELPLTCFTSDAYKSSWTGAVEAVNVINTRSIVETRLTRAFIDLCNKSDSNRSGGVRHEIRPIRMRYLVSSLRAQEHQPGEVRLSKISSLTKSVTFFPG